jgi:hypothetical protein
MYRAITKTFSAAVGRLGADHELNHCQDTVKEALGGSTIAGKAWEDLMDSKTRECSSFLVKSTLTTENTSLSYICAGFTASAGGAVKPWAPNKTVMLGMFAVTMLAFLA